MSESMHTRRETGVESAQAEHFNDVVESDFGESLPDPVAHLLGKDFALSKINTDDREYLRLLAENVMHYSEELYPPKESLIQGDVGAALLEDPSYDMHALDDRRKAEIESLILSYFTRISRSQSGWQQDKLNEGIQTKRVEDDREEEGGNGVLGGLF